MMLDIRGMAPLLQVFDLPVSLAFYRDILGFEIVQSTSDWAWLNAVMSSSCSTQHTNLTRARQHPIQAASPRTTTRRSTSAARDATRPTPTSVVAGSRRRSRASRHMA